jgi:hypothetical protein
MEELDLSYNALGSLPARALKCSQVLQCLKLKHTEVSSYPEQLTALPALTRLNLSRNSIAELPEKFSRLTALTVLDLTHNHIEEFPAAILRLDQLEELKMGRNAMTALPSMLWKLHRLRVLNVHSNKLESIPTCIGQLTELQKLDLSNNSIEELRPTMGLLENLTTLHIDGNRLTYPSAEVVAGGLEAITTYFLDQLRGNVPCYRVKLIIVGSENVGKTSVLRQLRTVRKRSLTSSASHHQPMPNLSTDGIKIDDWTMNMQFETRDDAGRVTAVNRQDVLMSVWDFAGQNIYGTTHQFFLSTRALYIVAWNMEQPLEQSALEYWLCNIRMRAPRAPVIIVGTHRDKLPNSAAAKAIIR